MVIVLSWKGNSIRSTVRMTGVAKNTVMKLLVEIGATCAAYQERALRNLTCKRLQCDEIWSFVGAKDKNVPPKRRVSSAFGSVWTWTAIDADTKLDLRRWLVGTRDAGSRHEFMHDRGGHVCAHRVQVTTDGHKALPGSG